MNIPKKSRNGGFSFVEIIAVIMIIIILAVILTPKVFEYINSAREASAVSGAQGMLLALQTYQAKNGDFDELNAEALKPYMNGVEETNVVRENDVLLIYSSSEFFTEPTALNPPLSDGHCAVGGVTDEDGINFNYYQNVNGKIYEVKCEKGVIDKNSVNALGD